VKIIFFSLYNKSKHDFFPIRHIVEKERIVKVRQVGFSAHVGWGDSVLHVAKVGFSAHVGWGDSVLHVSKVGFSGHVGWGQCLTCGKGRVSSHVG
jgi:hypothetical protein